MSDRTELEWTMIRNVKEVETYLDSIRVNVILRLIGSKVQVNGDSMADKLIAKAELKKRGWDVI